MKILLFVYLVVGVLLTCQESSAQERVGFRTWRVISEPSNERRNQKNDVQYGWLCYGGKTGRLQSDCPVSFELFESKDPVDVTGVVSDCVLDSDGGIAPLTCGHGGHIHFSPVRPVIFDGTKVLYPGDTDGNDLTVTDAPSPINEYIGFLWSVSHVGGYYDFKSSMRPPDGKKFLEFTFNSPTDIIIETVDRLEANGLLNVTAKADGLRQLPDSPFYDKGRGGAFLHPDNLSYAAQDITHAALTAIGRIFQLNTGSNISYNDISLPKGGVFDFLAIDNRPSPPVRVDKPWAAPHASHRAGLEVDVNKPNQERCDMNTSVQLAVDSILRRNPLNPDPNSKSALLCETMAIPGFSDTGNYHIVVTNLVFIPGYSIFVF